MKKRHKYLFWLNLGLISTFFAEVISGADIFPFFHGWGIVVIVPIYLLHSLILITLVYRHGRPTLAVLYTAGLFFGLYEAYITKILWNPSWEGVVLRFADIAIFEVIVLVLFWHVWMSFILPVLAAETWLTNSTVILSGFPLGLKRFFSQKKGWTIIAILSGFFLSINLQSPEDAVLAGLGAAAVIGISGGLWRRSCKHMAYHLDELLPDRKEFRLLLSITIILYVIMGIILRPEAFPSLIGHITIWIFYGISIYLFIWATRNTGKEIPLTSYSNFPDIPQTYWFWLMLIFILSAVFAETILKPVDWLIGLVGWYGSGILGLVSLVSIIRNLLKEKSHENKILHSDYQPADIHHSGLPES